ncbi:FHIPEP family type III secretion protein [Leadbettera azotonutricia]|uniref:Flagellar biosynthesis protein n=1 Tax=Leadbettera azotonutricia (strain ATCC BAA-888 / DSM 13862 / ZAS-9) TaxID=545695 RepID=F5Y7C4_LEAAZ|nr:FHIPEP family type III secretion protein [Leadbettera azotonutricia]AEF81780.1 flagellar biosynthesis protein [Leadbettera azotonutricia ZAS-9]
MGDELDSTQETLKALEPYISACDAFVASSEGYITGLRYDDDFMFAPLIIVMEQGPMAEAISGFAKKTGLPIIDNVMLARNLFSYGKLGQPVPELCYREIMAAFSRLKLKKVPLSVRNRRIKPIKRPRLLTIEMGQTLWDFLGIEGFPQGDADAMADSLAAPLNKIRKRLCRLMGFVVPRIRVSRNPRLNRGEYRILLKGLEAGRRQLDLDWYGSDGLGFNAELIHGAARIVAAAIVRHVDEIALKRAPDFLGRDEVQQILDTAEAKYPVVTGEVKNLLSLGSIRDILRGLLSEQVSIRHMPAILETLADWGSFGPAPNDVIIEQIRQSLKRQICLDYAGDGQVLRVLTLETNLEQSFADRLLPKENETPASDDWLDIFSPAIKGMEDKGLPPIILCSPMARSWLKEITRKKFPNLAVLSYIEIPPDINVEPVGEIRLEEGAF